MCLLTALLCAALLWYFCEIHRLVMPLIGILSWQGNTFISGWTHDNRPHVHFYYFSQSTCFILMSCVNKNTASTFLREYTAIVTLFFLKSFWDYLSVHALNSEFHLETYIVDALILVTTCNVFPHLNGRLKLQSIFLKIVATTFSLQIPAFIKSCNAIYLMIL